MKRKITNSLNCKWILSDIGYDNITITKYKSCCNYQLLEVTVQNFGGMIDCKKKWASIRDQLRRTLQKRKTKSGQAAENARKYKYEDILTFLLPHVGEMEGLTNVSQVGDEEHNDFEVGTDMQYISTEEIYEDENISNVDKKFTEEEKTLAELTSKHISMRSRELPSPSTNKVSAKKYKFATPYGKKRKLPGRSMESENSRMSQLMAYILAEKEADKDKTQNSQTCKQDPVDAFLCGIAPTLKSLDAILLNEAKGKIFSVVQELELRQLKLNASCQERYFMANYSTTHAPSSAQSSPSSIPEHTIPNYSTLP